MKANNTNNNNNNQVARCPITGQVGVCPSSSSSFTNNEHSSLLLPPGEQQAQLWQSLLQRNSNGDIQQQKQKQSHQIEDAPPELMESASKSFSMSDDSDCSGEFSLASTSTTKKSTNTGASTASSQQQQRSWPTYDQVSAHVLVADYRETLTSGADLHTEPSTKLLCPHGALCQARIEFFEAPSGVAAPSYTGLLAPGQTVEHCLVRLSSALRPVDQGAKNALAQAIAKRTFGAKLCASQILPAAAIKLFRGNGVPSGNILCMGSKVGQADRNFFQHALCTAVTEKIPSLGIPFLRRFSRYSQYPLSLGLSELCQYDQDGRAIPDEQLNFPFALCLQPVAQMPIDVNADPERPFDAFIDDVQQHVPAGTHLFDIYVAPTPESLADSKQLQRIGRVVSTSQFVYSSPTDGLTFRHQVKEDDLQLRPEWEQRMHSQKVQTADGSHGTVAKLTGWQLFEEHIQGNEDYVDFEKESKQHKLATQKSVSFADETPAVAIPGWTFCGFRKARVNVGSTSL